MMGNILTDSAKLLVKLHAQGSRSIDLTADSFTIGRKPDNDLPIDDHTVSSRHAKIVRVQSVYFLEDLKSTNGTAVNGKPVERAQLHDADVITIGQHRIIFQDNAPSAVASASASSDLDQTMAISGKHLSPAPSITAKVVITSGKTDRLELPSHENGKPDWIAGRRGDPPDRMVRTQGGGPDFELSGSGFTISPSEGSKRLLVSGKRCIRAAGS